MKLCLVTPTRNRPVSFSLLERFIVRQRRKPDDWVVVNDGDRPYRYTLGQLVIHRKPVRNRWHSLCLNLLAAIPHMKQYDAILIVEDDDWYHPAWTTVVAGWLKTHDLVGAGRARFYNYRTREFHELSNRRHASLACTALARDARDMLERCCRRGNPFIDIRLWRKYCGTKRVYANGGFHVGLKGSSECPGIGMGHKRPGLPDPKERS